MESLSFTDLNKEIEAMEQTFEFETLSELNRWFRGNIKSYMGYHFNQYKDQSTNKWVIVFGK